MAKKEYEYCQYSSLDENMICFDRIPAGIAELKYTGDKLLVEMANKSFYKIAVCGNNGFCDLYERDYFRIITEEDRARVKKIIDNAVCKNNGDFCFEYRVRLKNKAILWKKTEARKIRDDFDGTVFMCSFTDITKEKNIQAELEKEKDSFYTMAALSNTKFFEYDMKSDTLSDITGGKINRFLKNFTRKIYSYDVFVNDDEDFYEKIIKSFKSGEKEIYLEMKVNCFGKTEWHGLWGKTVFDEKGSPIRIVGKTQNIDYEKRREIFISNSRHIDNLTGIYTGEYAKKLISQRFIEAYKYSHAVIVFDVDDFSRLNIQLGVNLCDQVLSNIGNDIQNILDDKDIIGRISGDGFIIYIDKVASEKWLEIMLEKINNIITSAYSGEIHKNCIRGSIGTAISKEGDTDFEKTFEKADYALYAAKSMGKNKFYIFSEKDLTPFFNKSRKVFTFNEKFIYKREVYAERQFNYEIAEFAFDVMESTQDVDSAVNILLDKVGRYFDLNNIVIRETDKNEDSYYVSYQWSADEFELADNSLISPMETEKILLQGAHNDIFVYSEYPGFERGMKFKEYINPDTKSEIQFIFKNNECIGGYISFEDRNERIWSQNEIRALKMIGKIISSYLLKMRAFREAEKTVEHLTMYDSVTGVMKYDIFKKKIKNVFKEKYYKEYALVYSDISNFKYINERYGYKCGDEILRSYVLDMDDEKYSLFIKGRIFSDNFIFLIGFDDKITKDNIDSHINSYNKWFAEEEEKKFSEIKINISTGIYIIEKCPDVINNGFINKIIDYANIARKYGKNVLSQKAVFFDSEMETKIKKQVEILTSMEKALINDEFIVVFQPKVALDGSNKIVGAEALVRWIRDDGKVVSPIEFIPLFEKNGFVVNVDFCVYEQVCRFLKQRIQENKRVVPVSVNVSRVHLDKDDFIGKVEQLVSKYDIPRELLEFELTENVFLENSDKAIKIMTELRKLNFKVSMDDFGSGYSSLNLLKKLPVDILKMDKGFLDTDEIKGNDGVVIKSIIDMAKKMRITVLCEGVETQKQVTFLQDAGCDLAQGYYFSKPVKVEEFREML